MYTNFWDSPLTLVDKVNFLPLIEPNPTDNLGEVKVSQHADADKSDKINNNTNNNNNNNNNKSFSLLSHKK
jgi:hypothetical protein